MTPIKTAAAAILGIAPLAVASSALDLTTGPTAFGQINGAQYEIFNTGNSGTGIFPAFVQIQQDVTEQGYNTSGGQPFNEGSSAQHNHDIQKSDLVLTSDGNWYEFTLDLNEMQNEPTIDLTSVRIYTDSRPSLTVTDFSFQNLRYDMDALDDWTVLLDTTVTNAGSGKPDMKLFVPVSLFASDSASTYVYLYSAFTLCGDGAEEWGLRSGGVPPNPTVPGPATLALMAGSGLLALKRRR
jgi:hypothetical protein